MNPPTLRFSPPADVSHRPARGAFGMKQPARGQGRRGFSLVEMLAVIGVMTILAVAAGPAMMALKSSGGVNQAIIDTLGSLEYARIFALSNHTFVRVAIGQVAANRNGVPVTVLVALYSVDGTLDADSATDMANNAKWRLVAKAVSLDNFAVSKNLSVNMSLDASNYLSPDQTDIPGPLSLKVGDQGAISFSSFIQFDPDGSARVLRSAPARFVDLAIDRPATQAGRNPFVVRISGLNGHITVLRKGDGIP